MKSARFFIDFDGTITTQDVVDLILERFAHPEWKKIEKDWAQGKIGSRECLSKQIALVSAARQEILALADTIKIDPHFVPFLKTLSAFNVPAVVVSDGFDVVIESVLKKCLREEPAILKNLSVYCNRLAWATERKIRPVFLSSPNSCPHGCANCKVRVMERIHGDKEKALFVGDGLSDRFAAGASDLAFAKGKLLEYCVEKNIAHECYADFSDINRWVLANLKEHTAWRPKVNC